MNLTNNSQILTNTTSNNFQIEFEESQGDTPTPQLTPQPTPSTGGTTSSSSGRGQIVSLKIIAPRGISGDVGEVLDIPLQLINAGETSFNDLSLNSSAFKHGEIVSEIGTSLDLEFLKELRPGQEVNFSLKVFLNTNRTGEYEILIGAESRSPRYKDWAKIHIDLQAINESQVRELIIFTEEFIVSNPSCIEITEVMKEAELYLQKQDYINAKRKTEEALDSCKQAISQVSVPRVKLKYFKISVYFISSIILAIILGLSYYAIRRRKLQKQGKVKIQNNEVKKQ